MNNVTFQGKKEVIYGLRRAAISSKAAEYCRAASFGPNPTNRSVMEKVNKESARNFLDMACFDDSFISTIADLDKKETKRLANTLREEEVPSGNIYPLKIFKEALLTMCKVHKKDTDKSIIDKFLYNIENTL